MEGDQKCHCPNCMRITDHAEIPFLGFRCLVCYQVNKVEEANLRYKKILDFVVQK